jgi:hypothetical protein
MWFQVWFSLERRQISAENAHCFLHWRYSSIVVDAHPHMPINNPDEPWHTTRLADRLRLDDPPYALEHRGR